MLCSVFILQFYLNWSIKCYEIMFLEKLFLAHVFCCKQKSLKKAHIHILLTNFDFLLVLVVISALLTYPLGFSSPFFRYYCGGAGVYNTGQCSVGWSYMLAIMGVALSVFCPILWSFRWIKRDDVMDEVLVWPLPSNNHKENTFSSFHFSSDLPKTF